MSDKTFPFTNRELSWISFNDRVLDQARDPQLPLLERLKFLAITASNLDEFFMVRVGGLQLLTDESIIGPDPSGLSASQQLSAISKRVHPMVDIQYKCYNNELEPQLCEAKVRRILPSELSDSQMHHIEYVFDNEIYPLLSTIAVTPPITFPLLLNKALHICVRLNPDPSGSENSRFAIIPIGKNMSRFITLPSDDGYQFMLIEDIISLFVNRFFPGESILECVPFRITRNADLSVREDMASDLLSEMEDIIDARKRSDCVRLEIHKNASEDIICFLKEALEITSDDIYCISGPLDFSAFMKLTELKGYINLRNDPWTPQPSPLIEPGISMFDLIKRKDILLYHPYESFEPVVRFIEEAADDPDVITIKQILYRTSRNSPIVSALVRAAEKGKYVTAIVELKARFDEERNIEWARELEDAGVQVLYGVKGFKTHAKVCLVVKRSSQGLQRYMHFGTGNYNEITAHMYSDLSYFTCDEDIGADASTFFNAITGYSQPQKLRKLDFAPVGLRDKLLELIENETESRRQGQKAFIRAKLNSLADPEIIKALYTASQAGVKIDLNIRGICCLQPGIPGVSENISVISIVDRYLEHSRILHFLHGGEEKLFMSTADWMPRNLDKRIELLVPIIDTENRQRVVEILDVCLHDTVNAWRLQSDRSYKRIKQTGKKKPIRCQDFFYCNAVKTNEKALKVRRSVFEPHVPSQVPTTVRKQKKAK